MGFLGWLTGRRSVQAARARPNPRVGFLSGPGRFAINVVGEASYQGNIEAVAGPHSVDGCEKVVTATLVLDDNNRHDPNAVQVQIDGRVCGYLSRADAVAYRKQLIIAGVPNLTGTCKAMIVGGWDRGDDDQGLYGVKLDLPCE